MGKAQEIIQALSEASKADVINKGSVVARKKSTGDMFMEYEGDIFFMTRDGKVFRFVDPKEWENIKQSKDVSMENS